ncbi:MAG: flagellar hook capping FlgD N-terminal domain-containing protein [Acidimicrobiia bacterium]
MPTNPVSNTPTITTATTPSATVSIDRKDQFGKDTFLKLLVAQLRYQNPMQPTDPASFLTQSAQFSVVEKLDALTKQSESDGKISQMTTAAAFIGKRVTYSNGGVDTKGVVTGVKFPAGQGPVLQIGTKEVAIADIKAVDAGTNA